MKGKNTRAPKTTIDANSISAEITVILIPGLLSGPPLLRRIKPSIRLIIGNITNINIPRKGNMPRKANIYPITIKRVLFSFFSLI